MADIDLIPRQYVLRRRLWRRCRRTAAVLLSIVCLVAAARAAVWLASEREQQQLSVLRKNQRQSDEMQGKIRGYEQQKAAALKELSALDELRGRNRVAMLVEALDRAYLGGIWLDEIRSYRAGFAASPPPAASPGAAVIVIPKPSAAAATPAAPFKNPQRVELAGHARDHSHLAHFMNRLAIQPVVFDVQLIDSSSRADGAAAIDFKLSLVIAEPKRP